MKSHLETLVDVYHYVKDTNNLANMRIFLGWAILKFYRDPVLDLFERRIGKSPIVWYREIEATPKLPEPTMRDLDLTHAFDALVEPKKT